MTLEVRHLRLVDAIAREGTVTAASRRVHLTQSALSHQLVDLERRLGVALFHRAGKRMVPTPAGLRVLATADATLAQLRRTEHALHAFATGATGVLRLATECVTSYHWLPSVLRPFRARHPQVEVEIVADATAAPADALLAGALDLGIVWSRREDARLRYTPLFDDRLVLLVPLGHRLADAGEADVDALAGEHLMVYATAGNGAPSVAAAMRAAGVRPRRVSRVQLTEGLVALVRAGVGVSLMADWAAAPHVAEGGVVAVPVRGEAFARRWWAATLADAADATYTAAFTELLAAHPPARSARGRAAARRKARPSSSASRRAHAPSWSSRGS